MQPLTLAALLAAPLAAQPAKTQPAPRVPDAQWALVQKLVGGWSSSAEKVAVRLDVTAHDETQTAVLVARSDGAEAGAAATKPGVNVKGKVPNTLVRFLHPSGGGKLAGWAFGNGKFQREVTVVPDAAKRTLVFWGRPMESGVQRRQTYVFKDDDTIDVVIELGRGGKDFRTSFTTTMRRREGQKVFAPPGERLAAWQALLGPWASNRRVGSDPASELLMTPIADGTLMMLRGRVRNPGGRMFRRSALFALPEPGQAVTDTEAFVWVEAGNQPPRGAAARWAEGGVLILETSAGGGRRCSTRYSHEGNTLTTLKRCFKPDQADPVSEDVEQYVHPKKAP